MDLAPQYTGTSLLAHYGSPLVTAGNTVIVPVKTGASDGFKVEGRRGADGTLLWTLPTDYSLPIHRWVPTLGMTLTPKNRLVAPGAGGTVVFRDTPDAATGATGWLVFYGEANRAADPVAYDANVRISTPITCDRYGSLYFGFQVLGATPLNLQSGIARIGYNGVGSWVAASTLGAPDNRIAKVVTNCAPALSNDQRTVYVAVNTGNGSGGGTAGYLVALNSQTLARTGIVHLLDPRDPANREALILDDGSGAPAVGPDGDVYYGVWGDNGYRGFLLHFNAALTQTKTPAAFGWDITPSQIPARCVPSYKGASSYLLLIKYNNYVEGGGDGVNDLAIVDPNASAPDPRTGVATMKPVLTIAGFPFVRAVRASSPRPPRCS